MCVLQIDLGSPYGEVSVFFPKQQPGLSTTIGFFESSERHYIVKLLRTRTIGVAAFGNTYNVPVRRLLGRLPIKDNIFASSPDLFPVISSHISQCEHRLTNISRDEALESMAYAIGFAGEYKKRIERVIESAFSNGADRIDLFPQHSQLLYLVSPFEGEKTLAIVQEDVTQGTYRSTTYTLPLLQPKFKPSRVDALFLILSSLAVYMSDKENLGLDLFPHFHSVQHLKLKFPNVLIQPLDQSLTYVDTFGLFSNDGNIIQRVGNTMQYSRGGIVKRLANRVLKNYLNK